MVEQRHWSGVQALDELKHVGNLSCCLDTLCNCKKLRHVIDCVELD